MDRLQMRAKQSKWPRKGARRRTITVRTTSQKQTGHGRDPTCRDLDGHYWHASHARPCLSFSKSIQKTLRLEKAQDGTVHLQKPLLLRVKIHAWRKKLKISKLRVLTSKILLLNSKNYYFSKSKTIELIKGQNTLWHNWISEIPYLRSNYTMINRKQSMSIHSIQTYLLSNFKTFNLLFITFLELLCQKSLTQNINQFQYDKI